MNRTKKKHLILSLVLVIALIAAMALSLVSCDNDSNSELTESQGVSETITNAEGNTSDTTEETVVGVGSTSFAFKVKFKDGTTKTYTVKTDKDTVGEALLDMELISGSESQYGLMVEAVCGETLIYDEDKMYWAFYENGKYANAGVDSTKIDTDVIYSFEATPA